MCKTAVELIDDKADETCNYLRQAFARVEQLRHLLTQARVRGDGWKERALIAEDMFENSWDNNVSTSKQLFPNIITAYTSADGIKGLKHLNGDEPKYMIVRTHRDSYWNISVKLKAE